MTFFVHRKSRNAKYWKICIDLTLLAASPVAGLKAMTEVQAEEVIREAYELIEDILVLLRPELLIACQCATKSWYTQLGRYASEVAGELGSSWLGSRGETYCSLAAS